MTDPVNQTRCKKLDKAILETKTKQDAKIKETKVDETKVEETKVLEKPVAPQETNNLTQAISDSRR